MSGTPLLSMAVVTVSYNSSAALGPFLESVRASDVGRIPIVIADNGSRDIDESRALAEQFGAELLELDANLGYGGATNRAIDSLDSGIEYVLISNPDVVVAPDALSQLVATLADKQDAGAVGPKVLNSDGTVYPSARSLPSLRMGIGHALFSRVWPANPWTAAYLTDAESETRLRRAGWLSGSCLLVRRSAFEQIDGFDDAFFMYFEDVDLGYRLGKSGWANYYATDAVVTHTGAHSTTNDSGRMLKAHHDSAYRYLSRKYRGWYLAPLRAVLRVGLTLRSRWLTRG